MPTTRRLRLTLGYRGTRYAGWAVQSPSKTRGRATVQGTLEAALARGLGHPVRVVGGGRTDAGVHAEMQVASCDTSSNISPHGLQRVMERWLPDDLWIVGVADAPAEFDARRSAAHRWYRYSIWRQGVPPSAWQGRCLIDDQALDVAGMRRGAQALLGRHDFAALATRPPLGQSTVRTVYAADWLQISQSLLTFEICADAYLKQMVRTIVGSLLWVGTGHWTAEQFEAALQTTDRRAAGPNAPPLGLTLHRIDY
ncbi:MAG: tRNA pseudouridine(38-40) synthase TruA [Chloroflexi bacterium]|nr:tRNA pseudouridine(38-40) synthase TruA [Chloroflexota bacterium]